MKLSFLLLWFKRSFLYMEVDNIDKSKEGRCLKCRKQVEIKDPVIVEMKNRLKAIKGKCPDCGTTVFKILGKA